MSDYSDFFLNSRSSVLQLELFELTHPAFTKAYRIVRNVEDGVTVDLSPTEMGVVFDYFPARISSAGARDNLDAALRIDVGDVGSVIPGEVDAVDALGGFLVKPKLRYWVFRSDLLTAPIYGPLELETANFNFDWQGCSFEARAPLLNVSRTGERYKLERFPMLRGFL